MISTDHRLDFCSQEVCVTDSTSKQKGSHFSACQSAHKQTEATDGGN